MNKLITPILTPCGGLITRTKVRVQGNYFSSIFDEFFTFYRCINLK